MDYARGGYQGVEVESSKTGKRVISLTYHEITEDPRVLKQARALSSAGYDVTVYCAWPAGKPETEEIDGVSIRRFVAFSPNLVTERTFSEANFTTKSRPALMERAKDYLAAADALNRILNLPPERQGLERDARDTPDYYKSRRGFARLLHKIRYNAYQRGKLKELLATVNRPDVSLRTIRKHRSQVTEGYQKLFQGNSFVYAINLLEAAGRDRADVVHAHDIYCLPGGVCLARKLGARLVYDAHEYEPARATRMPKEGPQIAEPLEDDCFPFVDRIITVSESIADLYAQRFSGPRPTLVMNAPEIPDAAFQGERPRDGSKTSIRQMAGVAEGVPLLVFTGGIQRAHRGLDKVVDALVHLPDCHLASVGPRQQHNDRWLMRYAAKQGVADRITLLPPVDARDVPSTISTADLSLCPFQDVSLNHRFAMPNKLFEAAFARIPICVSDLPEMRRFVERLGIGRAMDQTDGKAIAEAVRDVLDHPAAYELTAEAADILLEEYSWQAQSGRLLGLYSALLEESPRQAAQAEARA